MYNSKNRRTRSGSQNVSTRRHTLKKKGGSPETPTKKRKIEENKIEENKTPYTDTTQDTIFYYVMNNDLEKIKEMFDSKIITDPNITDKYGRTALYWTTAYGFPEMTEFFILKGININKVTTNNDTKREATPLMMSIQNRNPQVTHILIDNGADVNNSSDFMHGVTPLIFSIIDRKPDIAKKLIENGALIEKTDNGERTPLHAASAVGDLDIVEILIKKKSDMNKGDDTGETALHKASRYGHDRIVQKLIESGADVNKSTDDGYTDYTPIELAGVSGHKDIVSLLLKAGATDFDHEDLATDIYKRAQNYAGNMNVYDNLMSTRAILIASLTYIHMPPKKIDVYEDSVPTKDICEDIYDPITLDTINTKNVLNSEELCIFLFNDTRFVINKRELEGEVETNIDSLLYECKEANEHASQRPENLVLNDAGRPILYFNMKQFGIFGVMIEVQQLKTVIDDKKIKMIVIDTSKDKKSVRPVTSLGPRLGASIVSARHCQEYDPIKIGTLKIIPTNVISKLFSECSINGGKRNIKGSKYRKRSRPKRRTKKYKKNI